MEISFDFPWDLNPYIEYKCEGKISFPPHHSSWASLSTLSTQVPTSESIAFTVEMTLPTIIFVHGAWHEPSFFDKVRALLANKGYRTVAPQLPSVGRYPPVESIDPDIETVRAVVLKELDAGRDVVMNAHSKCTKLMCSSHGY